MIDISIVIPLFNEVDSLEELVSWISKVMEAHHFSYEIILVDDGSKDGSWDRILSLKTNYSAIRGIKFRRNYGKSAALNVGFEACRGEVVITLDADLQDSPEEIPALFEKIKNQGFDLVSGWKKKRHDPLSKTIPTKLFNGVTRVMSGISNLHDFNSGIKAYRLEVVKNIEVYGEMHRYIPVIAKWAGFTKIGEQIVQHYPRKYGYTKFGGISRFINGFLDLLSIFFVGKFSKRPMHFFGTLGFFCFILGLGIAISLIVEKIVEISKQTKYRDITTQPLFFIALVLVILGSQLFLTGFLAELISRNSPHRNNYLIEKEI